MSGRQQTQWILNTADNVFFSLVFLKLIFSKVSFLSVEILYFPVVVPVMEEQHGQMFKIHFFVSGSVDALFKTYSHSALNRMSDDFDCGSVRNATNNSHTRHNCIQYVVLYLHPIKSYRMRHIGEEWNRRKNQH